MAKASKSKKSSEYLTSKEDQCDEKPYISKQIDTSISILESPEHDVVLEALLFLSKYGDAKMENLQYLQLHGIIPKVLKLLNRNICILRVGLRLLSILLKIDESVCEMDQDAYNDNILQITNMYISHSDQCVREFCIPILARLATSCRITCLIFKVDLFTPIFESLENTDKQEILVETLNLFYILISAPAALAILSDIKCFNPELILRHFENPEISVQNLVLETFRKLTNYQVDALQQMFKDVKLVEKTFEIIMDPSQEHHHKKALSILSNCMYSEITNSYFVESLEFLKFCQWVKTCDQDVLYLCANIFLKLTQIIELKQLLFDLSVEDSILYFFRSTDKKVLNLACQAVSNMTQHTYCCQKMMTPVILKELLAIMQRKDLVDDPNNEIALKTIYDFCIRNYLQAIAMLFTYDSLPIFLSYLKKGVPPLKEESFIRVLEILNLFILHPVYKNSVLSEDFFAEIMKHLQSFNIKVADMCCEIITNCVPLKFFREFFLKTDGISIIISIIQKVKDLQLFKSILVFIHGMLMYKNVCNAFVQGKLLLTLKAIPATTRNKAPLIDRLLYLMYNLHLPVKFFETKRLGTTDKLGNKFYLVTGNWKYTFPFLEVFIFSNTNPINHIYLVDYTYKSKVFDDSSTDLEGSLESDTSIHTIRYGHISQDPYLPKFICYVNKYLKEELCLTHKIKLLAEFVDSIMCGPKNDLNITQKVHTFSLHIEAIKFKLGSSIIPIGFLRIGFYCERALLFKAIADKVQIPTSLVKGNGKLYWNEVALMSSNVEGSEDRGRSGNIQMYVVDLMNDFGKLLRVGSKEANIYCHITG